MSTDAKSFLSYWRNARVRTLRILQQLPPEDLEWSLAPGKFSFGDALRHLAAVERFVFVESAAGRPLAYPGHSEELASGIPAVCSYMDRLHSESQEIISSLAPQDLTGSCLTPTGDPIPIWKWFRAMAEHEAHHRGQLYMMLGLRGHPVPPVLGLTEEELLARSRSRA
jgi:uncharacterized damage-inducible protein DinB